MGEGHKSEDNLQESVLPFHYEGFRDASQVFRLGSKHLYPSEHLATTACFWGKVFFFNLLFFMCIGVFSNVCLCEGIGFLWN